MRFTLISGAAVIYAIDELLGKQLRQVRAEQTQVEEALLSRFALEVGLEGDSAAFARFRKLSRGWKAEKLSAEELLGIRSLSRHLAQLDDEQLIDWALRLQKELKSETAAQAQVRNRVAFVSTIIRPLSTKWLSRWRVEGRRDISIEDATDRAEELLKFELGSKQGLTQFFELVYSFFEDVVVFSGNSKPGGTVAESSKRAYAAAWSNFIFESRDEVWSLAEGLKRGQFERMKETVLGSERPPEANVTSEMRASSPGKSNLGDEVFSASPKLRSTGSDIGLDISREVRYSASNSDWITPGPIRHSQYQSVSSSQFQGLKGGSVLDVDPNQSSSYLPPTKQPMIRIGVSSVSSPELVAHKDWLDLAALKTGLRVWLGSLSDVWGEDAQSLTGKVESVSNDAVLASIALPPSDAITFADRAIRVANF